MAALIVDDDDDPDGGAVRALSGVMPAAPDDAFRLDEKNVDIASDAFQFFPRN
jgi:hypothetical protein